LCYKASGQTIPGTAQPGAVERALQPQLPALRQDRIQIPAPSGFDTPKGAENFHFVLKQVSVGGVTPVSNDAVAATYSALIGHDVTLTQIFEAARGITDLYAIPGRPEIWSARCRTTAPTPRPAARRTSPPPSSTGIPSAWVR
jgi:hemolysin activation/secretion protein